MLKVNELTIKCQFCLRKGCTEHSEKDLIKKVDRSYFDENWAKFLYQERAKFLSIVERNNRLKAFRYPDQFMILFKDLHRPKIHDLDKAGALDYLFWTYEKKQFYEAW